MSTDVKQPVAWEICGKLQWLVDQRPNMQRGEWEHRFREFWPHPLHDLSQSEARQEMFQVFSSNKLAQRRYASELDNLIANNEGWKAKIADISFVCSAFPVCDVGVCHHRSIEHRKGYEDKNGRAVPPHAVRPFFGHRGRLSETLNQVHKAAMNQVYHDTAIDMMISHLLRHKSGFYIIDRCPNCKKEFEALRVERQGDYQSKFREYDDQGILKFEYDIGVLRGDEKLMAILEALHTHKMGAKKRAYAENNGYPWIEYQVRPMLLSQQTGAVRSMPGGWLALDAIKLKIGHSGATRCRSCAEAFERESAAVERVERLRKSINDGVETRRRVLQEIIKPAEQELDQIDQELDGLEPGFSTVGLDNLKIELAAVELSVGQIEGRLCEAESVIAQGYDIEMEVGAEASRRKEKSFCSKTGLDLPTEFYEMDVQEFKGLETNLSIKIDRARGQCRRLFDRIEKERQDLKVLREGLMSSAEWAE